MEKFFEVKKAIAFLNLLGTGVDKSEEYLKITYDEFINAIIDGEPNEYVREDLAAIVRKQIERVYKGNVKNQKPAVILHYIKMQASQIAYSELDMDMLTKRDFSDEVELFAIARAAILLERTVFREYSYRDEYELPDDDPRHPLSY